MVTGTGTENMESSTTPPAYLANRLSSSVPQYLVHLAHEPSIGLHYTATHAQQRAAPALAKTHSQITHRTNKLSALMLDVKDAHTMVTTQVKDATNKLAEMSSLLDESIKELQKQATDPRLTPTAYEINDIPDV